jgi:hypothetical protein
MQLSTEVPKQWMQRRTILMTEKKTPLKQPAVQDDKIRAEPCDSYLKLLKQTKILCVAMVNNLYLSSRKCQVEVANMMAYAIKSRNF